MSAKKIPHPVLTLLVILYALMNVGLFWDGWWHVFIGRDNFFIPPHDVLYLALAGALALQIFLWRRYAAGHKRQLILMITGLAVIALSAPFDELWHRLFGTENLSTPFAVWSPPHLLGLFGGLVGAWGMFRLIRAQERTGYPLLSLTALTVVLGVLWFIVHPTDPVGLYAVYFSPWAEVIFAAPFIWCLTQARRIHTGGSWLVATMFLAFYSIFWTERVGSGISVPPHTFAPLFVYALAIMGCALTIELAWNQWNYLVLGIAAGLLFVYLHVFLAQPFIDSSFLMENVDMGAILGAGILAGIFGTGFKRTMKL